MRIVTRRGRVVVVLAVVAVVSAGGVYVALPYLRAGAFVIRVAGMTGWPQTATVWAEHPYDETDFTLASREGSVRARIYRPAGTIRRSVVLTSGIHPFGIDEPRLRGLAGNLAASGLAVLTPEPLDLIHYRVTPHSTDVIEDAARWLLERREFTPDGRVGLMGISFSGGLSVVAAGRQGLRDRIAFVFALGGHGDIARVLRYLCTGVEPTGVRRLPHDYGLAVVLHALADRVVPPEQVFQLQQGVEEFLVASSIDMVDRRTAAARFEHASVLEREMAEPSKTFMHAVNTRDVASLGPRLLPAIGALGDVPGLSPERSPAPSAPVYLLHGTDDTVIPSVESTLLARELSGRTHVRVLLSGLITHAEVDRPSTVGEAWRLVAFWADVLSR